MDKDISLQQAQEALRRSEERLQALTEATSDWIWETDARGVYTYSSPRVKDLLGYTPQEVLGKTPFDLFPPKEAKLLKAEFTRIIAEGRPFTGWKSSALHKDGRRLVLETNGVPLPVRAGALRGWHGVTSDITGFRQAEKALLFATMQLEAQAEASVDGILAVDTEKRSILFNKRFGEIWKIPQNILDNKDDTRMMEYALKQVKDPAEFRRRITYLYAHEDEKSRDEIEFADGRCLDRYSSPIISADGKYHGRIWYFRDITEQKKIEHERKLISNRIRQVREEEKKGFSSALHDAIGTMVVGLSSSLFIAKEELRRGSPGQASAELAQTQKLLKEIAAMMKRICVDVRPLALEISGLGGALSELVSKYRRQDDLKVSSCIDLPDDWKTNDNQFRIVVYRLVQEALTNAVKYSRAKNLELIMKYDENKVMLSISDNGCGFEGNLLKPGGTGLGLKIMQEEVVSVGGTLLIDSKPGRGTIIKAEFPRLSGGD